MIYHITTKADWEAARMEGSYSADSLIREGFIHCSTAGQVEATANRFFHGRMDLVLLHIDELKVGAEIVYENLEGGSTQFPHVYGPLPLDSVLQAKNISPLSDGSFRIDLPD